MVLCSSVTGQREMTQRMVTLSAAERDTTQANVGCSTRPGCAGSMYIIHRAVQDLNAATPTGSKISPPDHSFPMLNQRNKYLHNVLVQVKENYAEKGILSRNIKGNKYFLYISQ